MIPSNISATHSHVFNQTSSGTVDAREIVLNILNGQREDISTNLDTAYNFITQKEEQQRLHAAHEISDELLDHYQHHQSQEPRDYNKMKNAVISLEIFIRRFNQSQKPAIADIFKNKISTIIVSHIQQQDKEGLTHLTHEMLGESLRNEVLRIPAATSIMNS